MVITKCKDVTKQGFCKYSPFSEKSPISTYSLFWGGGGGGRGRRVGGWLALIWVWVGGRGGGMEVGANSKLVAYSNKYGIGSLWKKSDISRRYHWFLRAQTWISILMAVLPNSWKFTSTNRKHYPCQIRVRSRHRNKFLCLFHDRHFAEKPAVA